MAPSVLFTSTKLKSDLRGIETGTDIQGIEFVGWLKSDLRGIALVIG